MVEEIVNEMPREYYKADNMLRYNPLWALVLGERSVGKSFEFKRRSIVTPDSLWVYLRRTDTLRKDPKNWKSYLSDLLQAQVIDLDAEYKVNSEGIWVDGIQKVIFSALSTDSSAHSMNYLPDSMQEQVNIEGVSKAKKRKVDEKETEELKHIQKDKILAEVSKISTVIYDVEKETKVPVKDIKKKIVFEEILEPKNRYIKNEVEQLFEFYVTVDRYTNTQLFGIANLMTSSNPYFEYFGIRPFTEEFRWYKNKTLLVQNVKLEAMESFVKSQRFYNLIEGTDYADYLTNNTPWQDDNYAVEKRPVKSKLIYNIRLKDELYGIWELNGLYYISKKNNPQCLTFAGLKSMIGDDIPIKKNEHIHKMLNTWNDNGALRYETIQIKDIISDVIYGNFKEM